MNVWLGRHPARIAGIEKGAHEHEKDIRSMLLEGGRVRGRLHIPPNVAISDCERSRFLLPRGRNAAGQRIDQKPQLREQKITQSTGYRTTFLDRRSVVLRRQSYIYASTGKTDADL